MSWKDRTAWSKVLLVAHLICSLAAAALIICDEAGVLAQANNYAGIALSLAIILSAVDQWKQTRWLSIICFITGTSMLLGRLYLLLAR